MAAAGAAALAAAAFRTAYAEAAFERGLDFAEDVKASPATDVPGRLEAYETAMSRDPGEALYALRAGQIRLRRARPRGGVVDRAELSGARILLRRAAESRPLDCRPHAELARAARVDGDAVEAGREAATAVRLGPWSPNALATAAASAAWAWRADHDVQSLRTALRAASTLATIGQTGPTNALLPFFEDAGPDLAADLLEATAQDAALRTFAAAAVRGLRPELSRMLSARSVEPERTR